MHQDFSLEIENTPKLKIQHGNSGGGGSGWRFRNVCRVYNYEKVLGDNLDCFWKLRKSFFLLPIQRFTDIVNVSTYNHIVLDCKQFGSYELEGRTCILSLSALVYTLGETFLYFGAHEGDFMST